MYFFFICRGRSHAQQLYLFPVSVWIGHKAGSGRAGPITIHFDYTSPVNNPRPATSVAPLRYKNLLFAKEFITIINGVDVSNACQMSRIHLGSLLKYAIFYIFSLMKSGFVANICLLVLCLIDFKYRFRFVFFACGRDMATP